MTPRTRAFSTIALLSSLLVSTTALAGDPPLRVGRISYMEGNVSFHGNDDNDWTYATLNYPVVAGNTFWTEPSSRSEVQIGPVDIRMDHATEMQVSRLDDTMTQITVPQGTVNIQFDTVPVNGSFEVVTPAGLIELKRPGTYHIDAGIPAGNGAPPSPVQVTTLEGEVAIQGPRSVLQVMPGETAIIGGNPASFTLQEAQSTPFDDWALARERREATHYAAQYVSPQVTGYDDLDNYGQWSSEPDYGTVWYPSQVAADWVPYRDGHWAYIDPWGWTWVDNAPWGFAPFHYGRWAQLHDRWCWIPGDRVARPIYAPALVAFIGGGTHRNDLAWVPLGPREPYHPYYRASTHYVRSINGNNIGNMQNQPHGLGGTISTFRNARAATAVPVSTFQHGEPVHRNSEKWSNDQLQRATVTPSLTHFTPSESARNSGPRVIPTAQATTPPVAADRRLEEEHHMQAPAQAQATPATPSTPSHFNHEQKAVRNNSPIMVYDEGQPTETRPVQTRQPGPRTVEFPHAETKVPAEARPIEARPAEARQNYTPTPIRPQEVRAMPNNFVSHQNPPLPRAEMTHPQQQAPIAPTHEGWKRMPEQQHSAPQPQQQHTAPAQQHGNGSPHENEGHHDH